MESIFASIGPLPFYIVPYPMILKDQYQYNLFLIYELNIDDNLIYLQVENTPCWN